MSPQLRFPKFTDEWQLEKLGDFAKFSKGTNISKDDIDENGAVEAIRYGELYTMYNETIEEIKSRTNLMPSSLVFSKKNDVIIPASGETHIDIATASCVLKDNVALSGDINIIRSENNGVFLAYYFNNKKKVDIARLAQGVSVVHLYGSNLKDLMLNLPSKPEQEKIADFLSAVDERIGQGERKLELLRQYKKGVMQQIFSREVRFRDENCNDYPEWEEKSLSQLSDRVTTKNRDSEISFVLTNSATKGVVSQTEYFDKDIANKDNLSNYYVVSVDDFVYNPRISVHAPVGPIKRNHVSQGVMSPLYAVFRSKSGSVDFFEQYFETKYWHDYLKGVANYGVRHDRMNITTTDLYSMPIPFPVLSEQQKITGFLLALDDKIKAEEIRLISTRAWKKGLLQEMFA